MSALLFYFESSLFYNMGATHQRHERYTNDKSATQVLHERRSLILITTRVKTCFHIPILAIRQMKDYKRKDFILRTTFSNASLPCQNAFEKWTTKAKL